MVKPVPEGYHNVIPYLIVHDADAAIDWYVTALGAKETVRMAMPDGKVGHAELQLGDSVVMLADEFPDMRIRSPKSIGGSPVHIVLYVDDVDATFHTAVDSGARIVEDLEDKFYGDRAGQLQDPFGHIWSVMTHVEDVSEDEMRRRMAEQTGG